jgi:hypothetical protein
MTEQEMREKVIKGLECIISSGNAGMRDDCVSCVYPGGGDCVAPALRDALALLKAQEPREITKEEWEQWKKTPDGKRDPLYFMWVDCAPGCWAMRPEDIHELAYLMGEIKIWNKKPSYGIMMQAQRDTYSMGMTDVARTMTRDELENQWSDTLYLEFVDQPEVMKVKICQIEYHKKLFRTQVLCCFCSLGERGQIAADFKYMGKLWRCWTDYPDQETREETPWKIGR